MIPKIIFDNKVVCGHAGVGFGNLHPEPEDIESINIIIYIADSLNASQIFAPKVRFTNNVVSFLDPDVYELHHRFFRTRFGADGGLTTSPDTAIVIFNADCHAGIIYKPENGVLCVVHLGLNCFFREDGTPSILERAITVLGGDASKLMFWFGAGIGPCCNGYDLSAPISAAKAKKIQQKFGDDVIEGEVQHGPRRGQTAFNNSLMILRHAESLSFTRIEHDLTCTSCAGLTNPDKLGYGAYFSNVRDVERKGERNCFIAKLWNR